MAKQLFPPAIDLGTTTIRVVQLAADAAGVHLATWLEAPTPEGAIDDGQIVQPQKVREALAPLLRQVGVRKRFGRLPVGFFACATAMPYHLAIAKKCRLDGVDVADRKRARRAAGFKAAEFGKDAPLDQIDECSVTAVATTEPDAYFVYKTLRRPLIAIWKLFRDLGAVVTVENASIAILRGFPQAEAVIDVGTRRTTLIVPVPENVPDVSAFSYGAETQADRTSAGFVITRGEARQRVREEGSIDRSAAWSTDTFAREVSKRIRSLRNELNLPISRAVLVGNGSRMRDLAEALASEAGIGIDKPLIPALVADGIPAGVLVDMTPSIALAVGIGLGERGRIRPAESGAPVPEEPSPVSQPEAQPA